MRRSLAGWSAVLTAGLVAVLLLGPMTTARAQAPRAPATVVHKVSPLDQRGHLRSDYSVRATGAGYCWTQSFFNGRDYRCFRGHFIHDPCWKETGRSAVVCPDEPWSHRVLRIDLTRRLPRHSSQPSSLWGLRLGDGLGLGCIAITGATGTVGHHPITYWCSNGWVLLGAPDRRPPAWTMLTAKRVGGHYQLRGRKTLTDGWRPVNR